MVNTLSWPITEVDLISLALDTENVRLRSVEPYEADILAYLFEYEDALGLATEIVEDGFFDNDLPIVVREGKKLVVLEGNRRISALKGIANPTSVPRYRNQLAQLRQRECLRSSYPPLTIALSSGGYGCNGGAKIRLRVASIFCCLEGLILIVFEGKKGKKTRRRGDEETRRQKFLVPSSLRHLGRQ